MLNKLLFVDVCKCILITTVYTICVFSKHWLSTQFIGWVLRTACFSPIEIEISAVKGIIIMGNGLPDPATLIFENCFRGSWHHSPSQETSSCAIVGFSTLPRHVHGLCSWLFKLSWVTIFSQYLKQKLMIILESHLECLPLPTRSITFSFRDRLYLPSVPRPGKARKALLSSTFTRIVLCVLHKSLGDCHHGVTSRCPPTPKT